MRRLLTLWAAPLRAGFARAVAEAIAGYAIFLAIAILAAAAYHPVGQRSFPAFLGWLWLVAWPAWRLRPVREAPVLARWVKGAVRAMLCGCALGLLAATLWNALWSLAIPLGRADFWLWVAAPLAVAGFFIPARILAMIVAALGGRARRRLRWQLTASYLAVIMLTVVTMTALGSVAGLAVFVAGTKPDAAAMATSVADSLSLASPSDPLRRAPYVLDQVQQGRIILHGEARLNALTGHQTIPGGILVLRPDGTIASRAVDGAFARYLHVAPSAAILPRRYWAQLRRQALAGHSAALSASSVSAAAGSGSTGPPVLIGAAPVKGPAGRPVAVAVVESPDVGLKPGQVFPYALAVFGVSTIVVIVATAVPVLLLSSLFGFLLARGLTRRLEAVTRVTTAIASGDLSQRVNVHAVDESGRLAQSVNRMAAHLETAIGQLQQARVQAEGALRSKQELMASISHELRTPLAIVRAHLDTLSLRQPAVAGPAAAEGEVVLPATTLRALRNETERLANLVDELFTLSRAETGALDIVCRPVDVAALVEEVAALMRPLAQNEGRIVITVDARPGLPMAFADADRLRQILENLVRNAVRHTPDGGIIALSVSARDDGILISVADTGEGIPPEHLPHIFDRFYRVDKSRARETGGLGLGLAIVREFVEHMGGSVTVESVPGEGSCFHVLLPLARPARPAPLTPLPRAALRTGPPLPTGAPAQPASPSRSEGSPR